MHSEHVINLIRRRIDNMPKGLRIRITSALFDSALGRADYKTVADRAIDIEVESRVVKELQKIVDIAAAATPREAPIEYREWLVAEMAAIAAELKHLCSDDVLYEQNRGYIGSRGAEGDAYRKALAKYDETRKVE